MRDGSSFGGATSELESHWAILRTEEKSPLYHAGDGDQYSIPYATIEALKKWADDPNCIEREACTQILQEKLAALEIQRQEHEQRLADKRAELEENPFDPRIEISADAKHVAGRIVSHLWIIFVLLRIVLAILYAILK